MTRLFSIGAHASHGKYPMASVLVPWRPLAKCRRCGRNRAPRPNQILKLAAGEMRVEGGRVWGDALCTTMPPPAFVVSGRVVDGLRAARVTGFRAHPLRRKKGRGGPEPRSSPGYFWLEVRGLIDLDLRASGVLMKDPCPACFGSTERSEPIQFVPAAGTWDGSSLFTPRNFSSSFVFCDQQVVDLAREHRWSNFRFNPLGVPLRRLVPWGGIDYLGKQWPPRWEPPSAAEGRTLRQWIALLKEQFSGVVGNALADCGPKAVPRVVALLSARDRRVRLNAAYALDYLRREAGVRLPPDARAKVESLLEAADGGPGL